MTEAGWRGWVDDELAAIRSAGRERTVRTLDGGGPTFLLPDGRVVVSFASNDYLGLSQHPQVRVAAHAAIDRWGTGAGAARLVVGGRPVHAELEAELAAWRDAPAAVLLSTGYMANLAVLTTFAAGARVVSDELNHASIIDAARLARAEVTVYGHGDVDHAEKLVAGAPGRAVVVSDSVFSMDGDVAPLAALSAMCAARGALLVLDDAHAVLGTPEVAEGVDCLRVGTLSKTLGALGGFVTGPAGFVHLLVNRARSYIFTTALAPADAAAGLAALRIVRSPEGAQLKARLRGHVDALQPGRETPIVPVVIGDERAALDASGWLLDAGLLVPAIRPPTVPPGTSRLRVALSAAHEPSDVARLREALAGLRER